MSDETDEWVENLGVTWFKSSGSEGAKTADHGDEDSGEIEKASRQLRAGPENPPGKSPAKKKEPRPPPGTIVMDPPIGSMRFDSVSAGDPKRGVVTVSVPHSDKDSLLLKAAVEGKSVGTVKIGLRGMVITLTDVQISSIQTSESGTLMVLSASKPAEISEE